MIRTKFATPKAVATSLATFAIASGAIARADINIKAVHPIPIATCLFADGRSATVTMTRDRFTYRFSRNRVTELQLVGAGQSSNLFKLVASFPRAGWTQLRFANGATSYILFHYYNLGNYVRNYEGVDEQSGLLIFQNGHRLAMRLCKSADGLEDGTNLSSLPDDPEDHSNDIIDDVERHH